MDNLNDTSNLIHNFNSSNTPMNDKIGFSYVRFSVLVAVAVIVGVGIGFGANKLMKKNSSSTSNSTNQTVFTGKTAGIVDKTTFKDSAEGILRTGGIDGEGNFHLERPGGESQNVYLTSTTVDLSGYVGKKVKVWGATFQAQKAGWLMDVGSVQTLQ